MTQKLESFCFCSLLDGPINLVGQSSSHLCRWKQYLSICNKSQQKSFFFLLRLFFRFGVFLKIARNGSSFAHISNALFIVPFGRDCYAIHVRHGCETARTTDGAISANERPEKWKRYDTRRDSQFDIFFFSFHFVISWCDVCARQSNPLRAVFYPSSRRR